jgi:transposase InsO family protein
VRGNRTCPLASQHAATPAAASDLISFLKALPDCRMRRGIRFTQWWMLLVAILSILSGQGSLVGMERFAKRHRRRVLSDNGSAYRSRPWREACSALGLTPKRTRPYTPRTNGKAERFIKTLLAKWAYAMAFQTSTERNC